MLRAAQTMSCCRWQYNQCPHYAIHLYVVCDCGRQQNDTSSSYNRIARFPRRFLVMVLLLRTNGNKNDSHSKKEAVDLSGLETRDSLPHTSVSASWLRPPSVPLSVGEERWMGIPWLNSERPTATWPIEYRREPRLILETTREESRGQNTTPWSSRPAHMPSSLSPNHRVVLDEVYYWTSITLSFG